MAQNYTSLHAELLAPEDDGAADHLVGMKCPSVPLLATVDSMVDAAKLTDQTVLYCYPKTGVPGQALPEGWDAIPGESVALR